MILVSRFESMLKTDAVYFFDAIEFEEIVQHYLDRGKSTLAKKAIILGLEQHPGAVILKLLQIELLVFENHLAQAKTLLSEIEHSEPRNEEVCIQKAIIFSKEKAHRKSIETLQKGLAFCQHPRTIWEMMAMEYLHLNDFDNARQYFKKCVSEQAQDYTSLYNIMYCFDTQQKHEEAIDFLNDYLNKNPYSEVAWHQLGCQYFVLKRFKQALQAFDYAILIDDYFIGAYFEKAKTLEHLKRYSKAVKTYLITVELDDPTAFAYVGIGRCFEKLKQPQKAIKYYRKAVHEDPLLDNVWANLSKVYYQKKAYQSALSCIEKALKIDDTNDLFWHRKASICKKLKLYKRAVKAFKECLYLGDVDIKTYLNLADLLTSLGKFSEAFKIVLQAKKTKGESAEIVYRVGALFVLLGKKSYGFRHLKNGLTLNFRKHRIVEKCYPAVFEQPEVQQMISHHKKQVG